MKHYRLPHIDQAVETVILANGKFPSHPIPLSILKKASYIVCCDGAVNNLSETAIEPDAIVGDCDSLSEKNKDRFATILHPVTEQDTNDLTKAVNFCIDQGRKDIVILGATGKREDHTIGNISLLCEYMKCANVEMISDHGCFVATDEEASFESMKGQQISIFCLDQTLVSSQNLLYQIQNQIFSNWWQATLNEATNNQFIVKSSGRTIVCRNFLQAEY